MSVSGPTSKLWLKRWPWKKLQHFTVETTNVSSDDTQRRSTCKLLERINCAEGDCQMMGSPTRKCSAPETGRHLPTLSGCPRRTCSVMACCLRRWSVARQGRRSRHCSGWSSVENRRTVPGRWESGRSGSGWRSRLGRHSLDEADDAHCWLEVL